MFRIDIKEWQRHILENGWGYFYPDVENEPGKPEHAAMLGEIFEQMKNGRRTAAYTEYLPHWHLDANPYHRKLASGVLGYIWKRCQAELLPELNYLLVSKRTGLPGKFIAESWVAAYGSTIGFQRFCMRRAKEATDMLDLGLVTFT